MKKKSLIRKIWDSPRGKLGLILLSILVFVAVFAPILTPYKPGEYNVANGLAKPSLQHIFGTDKNGLDIFMQILYGTRISLIIGIVTGILCTLFGAINGCIAGYYGGITQKVILAVVNILLVIPTQPLMIVLNNISSSYLMMIFIFVIFGWSGTARIVRAQVLSIKERNFVKCAKLYGGNQWYIVKRHILPSISNLLIMNCALSCAGFMIAEAGLSFLGLGDPNAISWGKLLVNAEQSAYTAGLWAWVLAPGFAIFFSVTAFMNIGYALEEIFNPKIGSMKDKSKAVKQENIKNSSIKVDVKNHLEDISHDPKALLSIKKLNIFFNANRGRVHAVENVSIQVMEGQSVAIVGESGSGKSATCLAISKLHNEETAEIVAEDIRFISKDNKIISVKDSSEDEMEGFRGSEIALIPQDSSNALNPVMTIGKQLEEVLRYHTDLDEVQRESRIKELLLEVGISEPERRMNMYPHEFSGGMKQRILIAMAMAGNPKLLLADEPTTALDSAVQNQVLALINEVRARRNMAMILITHDLGVVKKNSEYIYVMYCGEIVEEGKTEEVLENPMHPYTKGLLKASQEFVPIPKNVPDLMDKPMGCYFAERCSYCSEKCIKEKPLVYTVSKGRRVRCHKMMESGDKL